HPNFEEHIAAVNETLKELGAVDKPTITVFNKIDTYRLPAHPAVSEGDGEAPVPTAMTLEDFRNSWMAKNSSPAVFISATEKANIDDFRSLLYDTVIAMHTERYPYDHLLY